MKPRQARSPSGLVHSAGAERSWLVKRDTLSGLLRVVNREEAVPRSLRNENERASFRRLNTRLLTEVYLDAPYRSATTSARCQVVCQPAFPHISRHTLKVIGGEGGVVSSVCMQEGNANRGPSRSPSHPITSRGGSRLAASSRSLEIKEKLKGQYRYSADYCDSVYHFEILTTSYCMVATRSLFFSDTKSRCGAGSFFQ